MNILLEVASRKLFGYEYLPEAPAWSLEIEATEYAYILRTWRGHESDAEVKIQERTLALRSALRHVRRCMYHIGR